MKELFKSCIFPDEGAQYTPGSPKRKSNNVDPYYDENAECEDDTGTKTNVSTPSLGQNMMRRIYRDPYEMYEAVKVLGTGSMVRFNFPVKLAGNFM